MKVGIATASSIGTEFSMAGRGDTSKGQGEDSDISRRQMGKGGGGSTFNIKLHRAAHNGTLERMELIITLSV